MTKIEIKGITVEKIKKRLKAAVLRGNYSLDIQGESIFLWINDNFDKESIEKSPNERVSIEDIEDVFKEHGVKVNRKYTKKEDRNKPNLPHDHEDNRSDTKFQSRIDSETDLMVKDFLAAHDDLPKKQFTVDALRFYIQNYKESDDMKPK